MAPKEYTYDEYRQVGTDYADIHNVEAYDRKMSTIRDFDKEAAAIIDALGINESSTIAEIGTGTANFAIRAARSCKHVYALDVSETMLAYARQKASQAGVNNIGFIHSGFLPIQLGGHKVDAIVTSLALHHLPDMWKAVALKNIHSLLTDNGALFLHDVIFSFAVDNYEEALDNWIQSIPDPNVSAEIRNHIKSEFSTFDWVIEGMLHRTGFAIERKNVNGLIISYVCKKNAASTKV